MGDLARKGDEGGGAVQAEFAEGQIVRLPMPVAPNPHGGVGQQSSQLWLTLLGQITPAALLTRLTDPDTLIPMKAMKTSSLRNRARC